MSGPSTPSWPRWEPDNQGVTPNRPTSVGSRWSGVDGSSEGGRLSTIRLPSVLQLYAVPLAAAIRAAGYTGSLVTEPALVEGGWVLKLIHEGDPPAGVPGLWHGHRVVLERTGPKDA